MLRLWNKTITTTTTTAFSKIPKSRRFPSLTYSLTTTQSSSSSSAISHHTTPSNNSNSSITTHHHHHHHHHHHPCRRRWYTTTSPLLLSQKDNNNNTDDNDNDIYTLNVPENLTQSQVDELIEAEFAIPDPEDDDSGTTTIKPDWKPGQRKRPLVVAYNESDFENEDNPDQWLPRLNKRCGALAIKMGMMPLWDEWGKVHPCTVLYLDSNIVLRTFTEEKDGYYGVQVGAGQRKRKNVKGTVLGHYHRYLPHLRPTPEEEEELAPRKIRDKDPPYLLREFRCTHEDYLPEPGTKIHARHFVPGQNVDVAGISKGKGFQGGMKRWNFSGMPASHGTSLSHRALGSTGQCQDPGRVFKGKKMAGRMGGKRSTKQNSRIVKIDRGRDLIYVKGPVPGQKGNFVEIRDAVKKPLFATDLVEGSVRFPPLPTFEYEEGVDGCGEGGWDVMMPLSGEDPYNPVITEVM